MGAFIIITLIILCVTEKFSIKIRLSDMKDKRALKKAILTFIADYSFSILISLIVSCIVSGVVSEFAKSPDTKIRLVCVNTTTEELQELQSNVYIIPGVILSDDYKDKLTSAIMIDNEVRKVDLMDIEVYLDDVDNILETRYYKFSNPIMKFMFFDFNNIIEQEIHTTQTVLYEAYSIYDILKE